jgi:hypothetical protein
MPTFAQAMQDADTTGLPVVEGFAVQLAAGADAAVTAWLTSRFPDDPWTAKKMTEEWWTYRWAAPPASLPLGTAWETVRELKDLPEVRNAEPLLLARLPVANGPEAQQAFRLWGRVSDERLARITAASGEQHLHWSLEQMRVVDVGAEKGAWTFWKEVHGDRPPGEGVLVAHPDTGYTKHARLLPRLEPHADDPALFGKDFVAAAADALDPMEQRSLGHFPGHGTGTASVIAAANDDAAKPWGVAPGAKILPLRVSSSVIHLSFQNLCEAFVEAMERGAHVISMSLGGPFGLELLSTLVQRALDDGIIVVAAAGNNAPTVVFPARIPGVLACAASNALAGPWRFSGLGAEVAITAPGELVWHDWAHVDANGQPAYGQINGNGTSFATANIAGLAALWLSYHGRDHLIANHCDGKARLLPFLFRHCLQKSADGRRDFIRNGGFGAGIARADRLLKRALPAAAEMEKLRTDILAGKPDGIVSFPASSWWIIATLPTLAEGEARLPAAAEAPGRDQLLLGFLSRVAGADCDAVDRAEIGTLAAADSLLSNALAKVVQGGRCAVTAAAVRRYLLRSGRPLSEGLRRKLVAARDADQEEWRRGHPELSNEKPYRLPTAESEEKKAAYAIAPPPMRRLRAFAFDPSLATSSAAAAVNEVTIPVVFERILEPGPVGDYLEVVDVDPASDCAYAPVDLNHPFLLAQDGLPRSEGNPQFHQQMVYAVAMKTIGHFEEALGRPLFWSALRPWDWQSGDEERAEERIRTDADGQPILDEQGRPLKDDSDQFVRRLRLYPHALREQNAYYSPQKRAILFGYFPAGDGDPGAAYPGGVVFTCLAHDIIAHETTHAILDGMHSHFLESTNPDVYAFHEAFADLVALFQRFSYPELLRDQIARVRGRLDSGTLMTRLALQFGGATGRRQALRDALGYVVEQARRKGETEWRDRREEREMDGSREPRATLADAAHDLSGDLSDEETRRLWKRYRADPWLLAEVEEPHERGSILVAAVFDAYLTIYENRVADLKRIATGGTGVLPDGDLHPDLVSRMADEASKSARHVLRMCLRAMDYVPPFDITFGEFLRALITADADLVPDDDRRYRVAFIEAFRKWGIYPRDVRTLSEESLRWAPPDAKKTYLLPDLKKAPRDLQEGLGKVLQALAAWQPGRSREKVFHKLKAAQRALWQYFRSDDILDPETKEKLLGGIDTRRSFELTNLRPARRIGPRGEYRTEMVVEILQSKNALPTDEKERAAEKARRRRESMARRERGETEEAGSLLFRGGVTLIVSLEDYSVRYAIYKRIDSAAREARQNAFRAAQGSGEAAEYSSDGLPAGWLTRKDVQAAWRAGRTGDLEDMRASSCYCRRSRMEARAEKEPFALLHRS